MIEKKINISIGCRLASLIIIAVAVVSCSRESTSSVGNVDVDSICSPGFFWRDGVYANVEVDFTLKNNGEIAGYICCQTDTVVVDTLEISGHWFDDVRLIFNVGTLVVDARCKDRRFMTYDGVWKSPTGDDGVFFVSRDEGKDAVKQRELLRKRNDLLAQDNPTANQSQTVSTASIKSTAKIPYSITSTRNLTEGELMKLSLNDLRIIRNEIYARHGRMFKSSSLRNYFSAYSWYEPKAYDDVAIEKGFNAFERYNVAKIEEVETKKKKTADASDESVAQQPDVASVAEPVSEPASDVAKAENVAQESLSLDKVLNEAELRALSVEQLSYLRNEIYARHGLEFKTAKMRNYFNQFEWYKNLPKYSDVTRKLTDTDRKNLEIIKRVERQKK